MFHSKSLEIIVGLFVALGFAALFILAMKVSNLSAFSEVEGYQLEARFDNIGGLKVQAPVTMSGVRVGRVDSISFDGEMFEAVVMLTIDEQYDKLPKDSSAAIFTSGLLGEQYIALTAGGDMENLQPNDRFKLTQSALVLEELIGQFLFKAAEGGGEE